MLPRWPSWLSSLHLPSQCLACHTWPCADVLCGHCWQTFHHHPTRCTGCGLALPGLSTERPRCGRCLRHPPLWVECVAWTDYAYPWSQFLSHWKFGQQPGLAQHFARWMQQSPPINAALHHADIVLPLPLSAQRMRERGYNPAAQIARLLAGPCCDTSVLQRIRHTPAQSDLTRAQRLRNVRSAFAVAPAMQARIHQRRVLLVDDVMTTGATLHAATRCLLQAGAAQVRVLCVARTP